MKDINLYNNLSNLFSSNAGLEAKIEEEALLNPYEVYIDFNEQLNNDFSLDSETFYKVMSGELEVNDMLALDVIQAAQMDEDAKTISQFEFDKLHELYYGKPKEPQDEVQIYINNQFEPLTQMYLGKAAEECSTEEKNQAYALNLLEGILLSSQEKLTHQDNLDGLLSEIYDFNKETFNFGTCQKDVEAALAEQQNIINELKKAIVNGNFEEKYKELTGTEFDMEKIIEYRETSSKCAIFKEGLTKTTNFIHSVASAGTMEGVWNAYVEFYKDKDVARKKFNSFLCEMQKKYQRPIHGYIDKNNEFVTIWLDENRNPIENTKSVGPLNEQGNWFNMVDPASYWKHMTELDGFTQNFEKTFGMSAEELQKKYAELSNEALGSADKVTDVLTKYIEEQETFLDKQAQFVQGTGTVLLLSGALISLTPSPCGVTQAAGGAIMKAGQYVSMAGTYLDNYGELIDLATNNYHGEGEIEEYKALLKETIQDTALLASGYVIGAAANNFGDDVAISLKNLLKSESGCNVIGKIADISTDVMMSLTADFIITGEIDLAGEGMSQLISLFTGSAAARLNNSDFIKNGGIEKTFNVLKYIERDTINILERNEFNAAQIEKFAEIKAKLKKNRLNLHDDSIVTIMKSGFQDEQITRILEVGLYAKRMGINLYDYELINITKAELDNEQIAKYFEIKEKYGSAYTEEVKLNLTDEEIATYRSLKNEPDYFSANQAKIYVSARKEELPDTVAKLMALEGYTQEDIKKIAKAISESKQQKTSRGNNNIFRNLNYSELEHLHNCMVKNRIFNFSDFIDYIEQIDGKKLIEDFPTMQEYSSIEIIDFYTYHYAAGTKTFNAETLSLDKDFTTYLAKNYTDAYELTRLLNAYPLTSRNVGELPNGWLDSISPEAKTQKANEVYDAITEFQKKEDLIQLTNSLKEILKKDVIIDHLGSGAIGSVYKISISGTEPVCLKIFYEGKEEYGVSRHGQHIETQVALFANRHSNEFAHMYFGKVSGLNNDDGYMVTQFIEISTKPIQSASDTNSYYLKCADDHGGNFIGQTCIDFGKLKIIKQNEDVVHLWYPTTNHD